MAKKTRKKASTRKRAKTKATKAKRQPRPAKRRKTAARKSRKKSAKGITGKISRAFDVVVDTVKGTDALRNKYERTGTTETE